MAEQATNGSNGAPQDWVVDVDITLKEKKAFNEAVKQAQEQDSEEPVFEWYARFIKKWPYDGSPSDVAQYEGMKLSKWVACQSHVTEAFQKILKPTV